MQTGYIQGVVVGKFIVKTYHICASVYLAGKFLVHA